MTQILRTPHILVILLCTESSLISHQNEGTAQLQKFEQKWSKVASLWKSTNPIRKLQTGKEYLRETYGWGLSYYKYHRKGEHRPIFLFSSVRTSEIKLNSKNQIQNNWTLFAIYPEIKYLVFLATIGFGWRKKKMLVQKGNQTFHKEKYKEITLCLDNPWTIICFFFKPFFPGDLSLTTFIDEMSLTVFFCLQCMEVLSECSFSGTLS